MLFLTTAFPKGHWGIILCAWIGAFFCSISFGAGYTFTKDLYPTTLRSTALGTASASARIGSILSPIIAISANVHQVRFDREKKTTIAPLQSPQFTILFCLHTQVLPLVIYGATMFAAGVGSIWIWPETKKIHLIYTLEECEELAAGKNEWIEAVTCNQRRRRGSNRP